MHIGKAIRAAALLGLALGAGGCFLGYDSRWGETKRAQAKSAAATAPAPLRATARPETTEAAPATRVLRIRVRATPRYAAQTIDWQRQVRDLIDDANAIVEPSLGARLEVESLVAWDGADESVLGALEALRATDRGDDVDWVVGMIGNSPSVTRSFHQLGMAEVLGKHLVVRAASTLDEHDAIEAAFDTLGEDERARLRKQLRKHRATAILLHELGHTLGALHERDPRGLMHPEYDRHMTSYGPDTLGLMRIALAHRAKGEERARATELLAYLEHAGGGSWPAEERDETMARLRAALAPKAAPRDAGAAEATIEPPPLAEADRAAWVTVIEARRAGDARAAWEAMRPLAERYPDLLAVQDLRCQLAMQLAFDWVRTRAECDRLMQLSTAKPDAGR